MTGSIRINGEDRPLDVSTVLELLRSMEIDPGGRGTAIAMNGEIVPRSVWSETRITAGDDLEIVRPFAGG